MSSQQQPPYGQPAYGQPAYGQSYGASAYPPAQPPRKTSTTGPKITVAIGVVVLIVSVVLLVVGGLSIARTLPTDVLALDGSPGDGVVGVVDLPGSGQVGLAGDTRYAVYLVHDVSRSVRTDLPSVTSPAGRRVAVGGAAYSSTTTMGDTHAAAIASFTTDEAGEYTVALDVRDAAFGAEPGEQVRLFVVEDIGAGGFFAGLFGGVAGLLGGIFLGLVAIVLLVVGGIMWGVRRGNARRLGQA
ncbi:hypothetical protein N867_06270 [Actinotalea fermentans ATCC 43279 = JCM 9966 = DSM 3133]|nr:hypothetical protein N867_06270 [Actinotalea fermentans ATCC 43279 = JCM 9966 = DSM 3133]